MNKPSNCVQVVNGLHQKTNCSREPKFDSWWRWEKRKKRCWIVL